MHMRDFSEENRARCEAPDGFNHPLDIWSMSDWLTATCGELGEAANIIKKLNRLRDGIRNKEGEMDLRSALAKELADTYCYLDLLAQSAGIDLELAVANKFNAISREIGYPKLLVT